MAQTGFDRRRINGPEESFPPVFELDEADMITAGPSRVGRGPLDIRPICMLLLLRIEDIYPKLSVA